MGKEKVLIRIKIALEENEEQGIVDNITLTVLREVGEKILAEQERCDVCREGGEISLLLSAYARLNGYRRAYFIQAYPYVSVRGKTV